MKRKDYLNSPKGKKEERIFLLRFSKVVRTRVAPASREHIRNAQTHWKLWVRELFE